MGSQSSTSDSWTMFRLSPNGSNDNEAQTSITAANVTTLKPAWSWTNPNVSPGFGIFAQPLVVNQMVIVADQSGYITALDEKTGELDWQFSPVPHDSFISTPLYENGLLIEPSYNNDIYVLNASTGALVNEFTGPASGGSGGSFESSPVLIDGLAYVGETNRNETPTTCITSDQMLALDPTSFAIEATATLTPAPTSGATIWSSPIGDGSGGVYAATGNSCGNVNSPFGDNVVRFTERSLAVVWHSPGPADQHDWDFGASPVIVGTTIIDGAKDGYVYAYDATSGAQLWKSTAGPLAGGSVIGSLATDGTSVVVPYVAGPSGSGAGLQAFNSGGSLLWSFLTAQDSPGFGTLSAPVISHGLVFAGYRLANCSTNCDVIGAVSLARGTELWHYVVPDQIDSSPAIVQSGIYVGTFDTGTVYRFTPGGQE